MIVLKNFGTMLVLAIILLEYVRFFHIVFGNLCLSITFFRFIPKGEAMEKGIGDLLTKRSNLTSNLFNRPCACCAGVRVYWMGTGEAHYSYACVLSNECYIIGSSVEYKTTFYAFGLVCAQIVYLHVHVSLTSPFPSFFLNFFLSYSNYCIADREF